MTSIYYSARNERLKPIERRKDGKYLYENLEDDSRVVCDPGEVNLYPRKEPVDA